MSTYLQTPRVRLEHFEANDLRLLLDLDSDPDVMRYLNGGRAATTEEVQAGFERVRAIQLKSAGKYGVLKAIETESGEFMGWFLLRPGKKDPENLSELELGYRLKKKFWGRGFATEVSGELIRHAFDELRAKKVWAYTLKKNLASRRIMQKLGMEFVCEYDDDDLQGEDVRVVKYELVRELRR